MSVSDFIQDILSIPVNQLNQLNQELLENFRELLESNPTFINSPMWILENKTLLYAFCEKGEAYIDYIVILLNMNADPNIIFTTNRMTAFDLICLNGNYNIYIKLLPYANINPMVNITSPLTYACANGHMDIIDNLINEGADINHIGEGNNTALLVAIKSEQIDVVNILCDKGANIYDYILHACQLGNVHIYAILLLYGANVHITNEQGKTCLMAAVQSTNPKMVKRVLGSGIDVNKQNANGFTALMFACMENQENIIKLLLDHGADVNLKTNKGYRAGFFCLSEIQRRYNLPK